MIENPDDKIRSVPQSLKIVAVVQFLLLFFAGLSAIGFEITPARMIVGFIFLTFIPGYLILTLIEKRKLNTLLTVLYSVGLSLALLMFAGLLLNQFLPLIGISKPISFLPLFIVLNFIVLLLWVLNYRRRQSSLDSNMIRIAGFLSSPTLLLLSIPCISVLGIILQVYYGNNIVLLSVIVLISLVAILIGTGRFIPAKLYPLAIAVIAIALLLQYPNMSSYLTGADVNSEYYYSSLVLASSHWNPAISSNINGMLSIVMLSPIYSIILGINNALVYKVIYPLLFSLVPVGLFYVFRKLSNAKVAFLSAFFFISFYPFFTEFTALARQDIAELFLVLLVMLVFEAEMRPRVRYVFILVFLSALITSHYALSYIFLTFYLILSAALLFLLESSIFSHIWQRLHSRSPKEEQVSSHSLAKPRIINLAIILFYLVFTILYYTYVSNGIIISTIVNTGQHILNGTFTQFFNLSTRGYSVQIGLGGPTAVVSPWRDMNVILQDITEIFIVVGVLSLIWSRDRMKISDEYFVWAVMSLALIGAGIVLPYFATSLNMTRIYEISLMFLSLWGVSGGLILLERILKMFHVNVKYASFILLIILVAYFAFNTGFVYEVVGDVPSSDSLGLQQLKTSTGQLAVVFDGFYLWKTEVVGATWLSQYRYNTSEVFADAQSKDRILLSYGLIPPEDSYYLSNSTEIQPFSYIYLGHLNVVNGLFNSYSQSSGSVQTLNTSELSPALQKCDLVYSNGGCEIFYSTP